MKKILFALCCSVLLCFQAVADDEVFARQGDLVLTQDEMDAVFSEIPENHRLAFIRDGERVDQKVQNTLRMKQIAAAAREAGFDQDVLARNRMLLAAEKALAEAWIQDVIANAPGGDYAAMAEEYYLANQEEFMSPEILDVSHILISTETRPEEKALALVEDLSDQLAEDPARFDDLVREFSEDPAKATNDGRYPQMQKGQMVKPFEEAAFALQEPGQLSMPVKTSYGFHIIRLNRKTPSTLMPFSQVEEPLIKQAEKKYISDYRLKYIVGLSSDPIEIPEGAVESMLKRYFGENLENAPRFQE